MAAETKLRTLHVSGTGEVRAKPDQAEIRLAVLTEAKTAAQAVQENAKLANQVINAVKALGITEESLRTVGLNVYPILSFDRDTQRSRIDGYRAENAISVTAPLDLTGKVFDAGISAGANESSGITFGLSDERQYRETALEAAVRAAREDAQVIAKAMGVQVVAPYSIEVDQRGAPVLRRMELRAREADVTPILPGELTVSAQVRITYEIAAKS